MTHEPNSIEGDSSLTRKQVCKDTENSASPNHLTAIINYAADHRYLWKKRLDRPVPRECDPVLHCPYCCRSFQTCIFLAGLQVPSCADQVFPSSKTFPEVCLQSTIKAHYDKTRHFFQALSSRCSPDSKFLEELCPVWGTPLQLRRYQCWALKTLASLQITLLSIQTSRTHLFLHVEVWVCYNTLPSVFCQQSCHVVCATLVPPFKILHGRAN